MHMDRQMYAHTDNIVTIFHVHSFSAFIYDIDATVELHFLYIHTKQNISRGTS